MNLYQINAQLNAVLEGGIVVDEETGEILFDEENIEALQLALDEKLEGCALYLKNLEAEAAAIKDEETRLAARRKTKERKAERLKEYVRDVMADHGANFRLETPKAALSLRKSESVAITDQALIPKEFLRVKEDVKADKAAIKKALKNGQDVQGVCLVENLNLQVK